jgi:hypothetical protein
VRGRGKGARPAGEGGRAAAVREERPAGTRSRGPIPHQFVDRAPVRRRRTSSWTPHPSVVLAPDATGAPPRKGCAVEERVRDPRERAGALPSYAKKGPPARDHAVRRRTSSSTVHQFVDGAPVRRPRTSSSTAHQYVALAPGATGAPTRKGCAVEERVRDRGKGAPSRKGCAVEERVRDRGKGAPSRKGGETRQRAGALPPYAKKGPPVRGPAVRCRTSSSTPHQYVDAAPVRRPRTGCNGCADQERVRGRGKGAPPKKGCGTRRRGRAHRGKGAPPRTRGRDTAEGERGEEAGAPPRKSTGHGAGADTRGPLATGTLEGHCGRGWMRVGRRL